MELKDYYFITWSTTDCDHPGHSTRLPGTRQSLSPNRAGAQGTASFQEIVEAYKVLSDPERRRHYNHSLSEFVGVTPAASPVESARPQPEPLIPEQRSVRLHSQPEPLVPEPMSILRDFDTMHPGRVMVLQNIAGASIPNVAEGDEGAV
jgi:hypothetical protein